MVSSVPSTMENMCMCRIFYDFSSRHMVPNVTKRPRAGKNLGFQTFFRFLGFNLQNAGHKITTHKHNEK